MGTLKIVSKIGQINNQDEKIFNFIADFDNFQKILPPQYAGQFESNGDTCKISLKGMPLTLRIIDKEPFKTVKIAQEDPNPQNVFMWIQLKSMDAYDTRIRITIHADLNMMMRKMAKKPLQQFVDGLVDGLSSIPYV